MGNITEDKSMKMWAISEETLSIIPECYGDHILDLIGEVYVLSRKKQTKWTAIDLECQEGELEQLIEQYGWVIDEDLEPGFHVIRHVDFTGKNTMINFGSFKKQKDAEAAYREGMRRVS
jgi:hypothetical protein